MLFKLNQNKFLYVLCFCPVVHLVYILLISITTFTEIYQTMTLGMKTVQTRVPSRCCVHAVNRMLLMTLQRTFSSPHVTVFLPHPRITCLFQLGAAESQLFKTTLV